MLASCQQVGKSGAQVAPRLRQSHILFQRKGKQRHGGVRNMLIGGVERALHREHATRPGVERLENDFLLPQRDNPRASAKQLQLVAQRFAVPAR